MWVLVLQYFSTTNSGGALLRRVAMSEKKKMMTLVPVVVTEMDLQADERRCVEDPIANKRSRKAKLKPSVLR